MQHLAKFSLLAAAAMLTVALIPNLHAADWDKKTKLTVNEPIEVPGAILQPGNYVLKLVDSESNRHIVRFMNEAENEVISTVLAIPNTRLQPTGKTEFGWYETPANQPPAMRAWFYPGDNFGQEFVYDDKRAKTSAAESKRNVMSISEQDSQQLRTATQPVDPPPTIYRSTEILVERPDNTKDTDLAKAAAENQKIDQTQPAQRTAQVVSQPERADETLLAQNRAPASPPPTQMRTELPATAGAATLLGLVGLASLVGSFGIGAIRRRRD